MLWGAYHFGTGADGVEQADFFMEKVQPDANSLLVLDFESNPQGPSMTLEEARAFVTHVQSVTGRFPGLYAGAYLKQLLGVGHDPVLANCWFIAKDARYGGRVPMGPRGGGTPSAMSLRACATFLAQRKAVKLTSEGSTQYFYSDTGAREINLNIGCTQR
jgi:hypothetical protein